MKKTKIMKPYAMFIFILISLNIKAFGQIVEDYTYPKSTRVQCQYHCSVGLVDWWQLPDNCITTNSGYEPWEKVVNESRYLYLKWKNIEASAQRSQLDLHWHDVGDPNHVYYTYTSVGPFLLSFPAPTFAGGSTKNIPCYSTDPVTISLNPYKNTGTASEGIDENLTITSHFKWTLPYGWETTDGKTGTFEIQSSSITVIPPASSSPCNIQVLPFADGGYESNQYGTNAATLQITRNLENFAINGPTSVYYNTTYRYEAPYGTGVSYAWQLPTGWSGSSTTNYIDVTTSCHTGDVICTMTACNQSKPSTKNISSNVISPQTIISGPSLVCSLSSGTFTINNLPPVNSIVWTCGPNLSISSGQNTPTCTFATSSAHASSWVRAKLVTDCGEVTLPQKTFWIGKPIISSILGSGYVESNTIEVYEAILEPFEEHANNYYTWSVNGGNYSLTQGWNGYTASVIFYDYGYYDVQVMAINACSVSDWAQLQVYVNWGYYLSISPNPSTSETMISIESSSKEAQSFDETLEWDLEIYDAGQMLKQKKNRLKGKGYKLNTSGWKEGVYIVRANYKDELLTGKLVVKKQ